MAEGDREDRFPIDRRSARIADDPGSNATGDAKIAERISPVLYGKGPSGIPEPRTRGCLRSPPEGR